MKWTSIFMISLICLIMLSAKRNSVFYFQKAKYYWQGFSENKSYLIKQTAIDPKRRFYNYIEFNGSTFKDVRTASCGNDIFYEKTGTYSISNNRFTLNYTGGKFLDNVGGDSMDVYVKGRVYYELIQKGRDTVIVNWISGTTTKRVLRTSK